MYSYVIAYSKGSGIVTDMLDVTPLIACSKGSGIVTDMLDVTPLIACSKGSGIVTDMLDVTPTCYNFCPCGSCTWCGLHLVDVAATKKYSIHNCILNCTCVSFLRCDNVLECLCTAVSTYLHMISSCLLQSCAGDCCSHWSQQCWNPFSEMLCRSVIECP